MDIVFKGGAVVSDGTEVVADLAVRNGRVAAIGDLSGLEAAETVDVRGRVLLPGLVDVGVSLCRESEIWPESSQSLASLTADALQGGVTTIVQPVAFAPEKTIADDLAERRDADEAKARVDFSYHYLLTDWSEARRRHLRSALSAGLPSVWIANEGMRSGFPGNLMFAVALRELSRETVVFTRPNDPVLESFYRHDLAVAGMQGARHYESILPHHVEAGTVNRLAMLMEGAQSHVVLVGISCQRAINVLQQLREESLHLHAAATIGHLALSTTCLEDDPPQPLPLSWPPLRSSEEQQSLWSALDDGLVNIVTSGHHPRAKAEVDAAQANALEAPAGVSGLAHLLPLLLCEGVSKFRLGLEAISLAACADPAKIAGLYPRKGSLQIGSDADIVVCNMAADATLPQAGNGADYHDPFAGRECVGTIEAVFLGGKRAGTNGVMGRYVDRRVSLG